MDYVSPMSLKSKLLLSTLDRIVDSSNYHLLGYIPTSQHICWDEPLEGFDLERNCGDEGWGREKKDQGLHCEDQRHSREWGLGSPSINCVNRQHLYNYWQCLHRPVWSEERSGSWLGWFVRTATGYIAPSRIKMAHSGLVSFRHRLLLFLGTLDSGLDSLLYWTSFTFTEKIKRIKSYTHINFEGRLK